MIENAPVGYETYLKTKFTRNAFSFGSHEKLKFEIESKYRKGNRESESQCQQYIYISNNLNMNTCLKEMI